MTAREVIVNEKLRLTDHGGEDNLPDWSPDGRWIAYSAQGNIWVMDVVWDE